MSNKDEILRKCREALPGAVWEQETYGNTGCAYVARIFHFGDVSSSDGVTFVHNDGSDRGSHYTAIALHLELSSRAEELLRLLKE